MNKADEPDQGQSVRRFAVRRVGVTNEADTDVVATEEPLGIRLGYSRADGSRAEEEVSITMRTPGHDEDLAVGFLFTEGIIRDRADVQAVVPRGQTAPNGLVNVVRVELAPGVKVDFKRLERHFYTSSSCGICGKASIDSVAVQGRFDLHSSPFAIRAELLGRLPAALQTEQAVFEQTGGLHASGLFDASGTISAVREDVGRHNALDKLIGRALVEGRVPLRESRHRRERPRELRAHAEGEDRGLRFRGCGRRSVVARGGACARVRDDARRLLEARAVQRLQPAGPGSLGGAKGKNDEL